MVSLDGVLLVVFEVIGESRDKLTRRVTREDGGVNLDRRVQSRARLSCPQVAADKRRGIPTN
eukprot:662235-Amorphochlora_amoeboformis.AAC.1